MRELLGDRRHLDVEAVDDLPEVIEVGVEGGDHPGVVVRELEDGAVADHLPVRVAERRVADLPDLEAEHVVREDAVGRRQRVGATEVPLAKRRLVPDAHVLADGAVLGLRVAERAGPVPAFPVHELAALLALDTVERCADDFGVGAHSTSSRKRLSIRCAPAKARRHGFGSLQERRQGRSHGVPGRSASPGPCTPSIPASSRCAPQIGAASACRPSSRSPTASAYPRSRTRAISRASSSGSTSVRSVNRSGRFGRLQACRRRGGASRWRSRARRSGARAAPRSARWTGSARSPP